MKRLMFYEDYKSYILTAKFHSGHWTGYTTCPNDEIEELIDKSIHGGLSCRTSVFIGGHLQSQDKYQAQVGFETNLPDDCNISPEGVVLHSFTERENTWDKEAVFTHLKYVIDTAEFIHNNPV